MLRWLNELPGYIDNSCCLPPNSYRRWRFRIIPAFALAIHQRLGNLGPRARLTTPCHPGCSAPTATELEVEAVTEAGIESGVEAGAEAGAEAAAEAGAEAATAAATTFEEAITGAEAAGERAVQGAAAAEGAASEAGSNRVLLEQLNTDIRGEVDRNSTIRGQVVVTETAKVIGSDLSVPIVIGVGTGVRDSRVGPHTSVGANCQIVDADIADSIVLEGATVTGVRGLSGAVIGRYATVRSGGGHQLFVGDDSQVVLGL